MMALLNGIKLRTNWQDETSVKMWKKATRHIEQINVDVRGNS